MENTKTLYELARQAYAEKNFDEAQKLASQGAQSGDAECINLLGCYYFDGIPGLEQDKKKAIELFERAAEKGLPKAQSNLGDCYFYGRGTRQNPVMAKKMYELAANQGNAFAQRQLGMCYEQGVGTDVDYVKAAKLYNLAIRGNCAHALVNLGGLYRKGKGVGKNPEKAVELFSLGTKKGLTAAYCRLGECYRDGEGVERDYAEAVRLFRAAAEENSPMGQHLLGLCYERGDGVEKSFPEAAKWYMKSAQRNFRDSKWRLDGFQFWLSEKNDEEIEWIKAVADAGYANAQYTLATWYEQGKMEKTGEEAYLIALDLFEKAAQGDCTEAKKIIEDVRRRAEKCELDDSEHVAAYQREFAKRGEVDMQYTTACRCLFGRGVERDLAQAIGWLELAEQGGSIKAVCSLGYCYAFGLGVDANEEIAIEYWKRAAKAGDERAIAALKLRGIIK